MIYDSIIIIELIVTLMAIVILLFAIVILLEVRNGEKIKKVTYKLGNEITDEEVINYIEFVDLIKVPYTKGYYDTLISGYKLIAEDENISSELKTDLRKCMLRKGILI